jgi:hypothetical protein
MVALEVCNLCGGQGFVLFYHAHGQVDGDDRDTRPCPGCQGAGQVAPWLQTATGLHGAWRMEEPELQALLRLREYAE